MPQFDLYAELEVPPHADVRTIERAWRDGVRSVHPDRAGSGDERTATARTARLNIAREWLTDPVKRARYDSLRLPGRREVAIPTVDPLGSWPARRRRRTPRTYWQRFLLQAIPAFVSIMTLSFLFGMATNLLPVLAVGLGLFGLYAGVWVLVGVVVGRLND